MLFVHPPYDSYEPADSIGEFHVAFPVFYSNAPDLHGAMSHPFTNVESISESDAH